MIRAVNKLLGEANKGNTDTCPEFGQIMTVSPLKIKLDIDPTPLEPDDIVVLDQVELVDPDDIGKRVSLQRCINKQFLLLGKVK